MILIEQDVDKILQQSLIKSSLYRLIASLPKHKSKLMANEVKKCEAALLEEFHIIDEAIGVSFATAFDKFELQQPMYHFTSVDAILTSE